MLEAAPTRDATPQIPFELEALGRALRFQQWIVDRVRPYLGNRILEIGAGTGNLSRWLPLRERLILTEADPGLQALLAGTVREAFGADARVGVERLDLARDPVERFDGEDLDTILSFNVLEHIEDDGAALQAMHRILSRSRAPGPKRIVKVVPAHAWAYGTIDKTFGHYRRYSVERMRELARALSPEIKLTISHINVVGLLGWIVAGKIQRKATFSAGSVRIMEALCPVIRPIDDFLHRGLRLPLGQSMLAVIEL